MQDFWIKLVPNSEDFISRIIADFDLGLEKIQCFTRWGKHSDLKKFADVLEEWDDIVGDTWDEPEILTLNPITWINDTETFKTKKDRVEALVCAAYEKSQYFLRRF